jgi:hypothetical protein
MLEADCLQVRKEEEAERAKREEEEANKEIEFDELPSSPERESDSDEEADEADAPLQHYSSGTNAVLSGEIPRIVFASAAEGTLASTPPFVCARSHTPQAAPRELDWYIKCHRKLSKFSDTTIIEDEILNAIRRSLHPSMNRIVQLEQL